MPKYPGISPYDNEKGTLGTAKKRWEKLYVKDIESDTISGMHAEIENLATTAENSVSQAVAAKNEAEQAKTAAQTAAETAATAAAGIQSVVETDVDATLSISGVAADAKVTGDWLNAIAKPVTGSTETPGPCDEFLQYVEDAEHRLLFGIKRDGSVTWQKGIPQHVKDAMTPVMENDEYLYAIVDPEEHVLFAIKKDGTVDWQKGTPKHVVEACNPTIENDEYIYLIKDAEDKVLFGIKKDGSVYWQKGLPKWLAERISQDIIESEEFIQLTQDSEGKLIEGIRNDGCKIFFSNVIFKGNVNFTTHSNLSKLLFPYTSFKGKKVSIIGSSSSTYRGVTDKYGGATYPNYGVTSVDETWWMQVINYFDMELLNNCSIGGSTVHGDSTMSSLHSQSYLTPGCCNYRVAELSRENTTPDIVLIYIGMNDFNNPNLTVSQITPADAIVEEGYIVDFAKAYDLMLYKIKSAYPEARIYCSTLPYFKRGLTTFPFVANGSSCTMGNEAIKQACSHIGAYVVDYYCSEFSGQTYNDYDVHLTKNSHARMARCFINKMISTCY